MEVFEETITNNVTWHKLLERAERFGFSKEVLNKFKEMGYAQGHEMLEAMLAEAGNSAEVDELISKLDYYMSPTFTMHPTEEGWADP